MTRAILVAACAAGLSACAHVYEGAGAERREIGIRDVAASPQELSFCLAALPGYEGPHYAAAAKGTFDAFRKSAAFRDFRVLGKDRPDPKGCDVILRYQDGATTLSLGSLEAYSAYSLRLVWEASAKMAWAGISWVELLAPAMHAAFAPGQPAYDRLQADKASGRRVSGAEIVARFGAEMRPVSTYVPGYAAVASEAVEPAADTGLPVAKTSAVPTSADVDEPPPARTPKPRAYAVVIGVGKYRNKLPPADFADVDARSVARYLRALGYPDANVATLINDEASKGDFEKYFERWLPNHADAGSEVFVYYSGHGAPNVKTGDAYLVPYDGDPTYIAETGYPLKKMYEQLAKLPASKITVVMDSCFSGAGGRSVVAAGARPLVTVQQADIPAKLTVLSASAGDQISNSYQQKGHGLFTYYFLKGIREKGDDMRAIYDYLKLEVSGYARRELNADQDPQWRQGR